MKKIISDSCDDEVESMKKINIESTDEEDFDAYSEVNIFFLCADFAERKSVHIFTANGEKVYILNQIS